jgi:hypothetical protein
MTWFRYRWKLSTGALGLPITAPVPQSQHQASTNKMSTCYCSARPAHALCHDEYLASHTAMFAAASYTAGSRLSGSGSGFGTLSILHHAAVASGQGPVDKAESVQHAVRMLVFVNNTAPSPDLVCWHAAKQRRASTSRLGCIASAVSILISTSVWLQFARSVFTDSSALPICNGSADRLR